jgi:hypothetical protein
VIRHQAVRPHLRPTLCAPLPHELDVSPAVIVAEEGLLAAVPSLRELTGQSCCHRPADSDHDRVFVRPPAGVNRYVWCPRNSVKFPAKGILSILQVKLLR